MTVANELGDDRGADQPVPPAPIGVRTLLPPRPSRTGPRAPVSALYNGMELGFRGFLNSRIPEETWYESGFFVYLKGVSQGAPVPLRFCKI